jgi:biopolymer transport protein ExbB/TolQ
MLVAVIVMIVVVVLLLYVFDRMRRRNDERFALDTLLEPLQAWQKRNEQHNAEVQERYEEIQEQMAIVRLHLLKNKRRNLEQRAKVQLVTASCPSSTGW